MKATLRGKKLIIELPLQTPKPSASGKTMVVASSHGVKRLSVKVDGKTVCLTANAFCYPDRAEDVDDEKELSRKSISS
jgi:hypothetical protein